jgi:HEAT repeat protein
MRLALLSLCSLLLVCAVGSGQAAKKDGKKDTKPDDSKKSQFDFKTVGGKSLQEWIAEFGSRDPSKRENAMRMVMLFPGEKRREAIGPLLTELKKHRPNKPIDLSVRVSGCLALGSVFGGIEKLDEDDLKHMDEAVKLLKSFSHDGQVIVRTRAVQALAQLGPYALSAIPDVIRVVDDVDTWEARKAGIETLTVLVMNKCVKDKSPPSTTILTTLYKRLEDNSMQVRISAVKALAQFSQPPFSFDKASVSEIGLIKKLQTVANVDTEPALHIWATLAVMTLKHQIDRPHLQPIIKMLRHEDPNVRVQAAQSLGAIGSQLHAIKDSKEPPAVKTIISKDIDQILFTALLTTLDDQDLGVVAIGMGALAQTDQAAAVAPVTRELDHADSGVRTAAAKVLGSLGTKARAAEPALIAHLKDKDDGVVVNCIMALVQMDSQQAIPALEVLSVDPNKEDVIKNAAIDAVKEIRRQKEKKTNPKGKVAPR